MALFIDSLAIMLIGLGSGTFLGSLFFLFSAMGKFEAMKEQLVVPAFVIGMFDLISGYEMSFTWPLPSGYNMLFGDPLLFFGLLLVAASVMVYKNIRHYLNNDPYEKSDRPNSHLSYLNKDIEWSRKHKLTFDSFLIYWYKNLKSIEKELEK